MLEVLWFDNFVKFLLFLFCKLITLNYDVYIFLVVSDLIC